jgi:hypothetical protein
MKHQATSEKGHMPEIEFAPAAARGTLAPFEARALERQALRIGGDFAKDVLARQHAGESRDFGN